MPIRYRCPQCNQLLSVASRKAGQPSKCPTCGAVHVIPALRQTADAPETELRDAIAPEAAKSERKSQSAQVPVSSVTASTAAAATNTELGATAHSAPDVSEIEAFDHRAQNWADNEEDDGLTIQPIERKSDELDLIPMVDCVFLLLIFYMITASYALQKTISFAPPASDKKGAVQAAPPEDAVQSSVIVQIDARNRILVDDVPLASVSDLADVLRAKMNGEQKNELVIEADPQALHETEVAVVDAANELEFQHVRMAVTAQEAD